MEVSAVITAQQMAIVIRQIICVRNGVFLRVLNEQQYVMEVFITLHSLPVLRGCPIRARPASTHQSKLRCAHPQNEFCLRAVRRAAAMY